jgi:hypothetical protein
VNAGFGAQEAVRVFARHLDRRALDAGDVAVGFFEHFGLEALALAVAQVLAQQHRRPVARLGAAGAGLDVDEAVVRVGRVREHAAEFDVADARASLFASSSDASSVSSSPSSRAARTGRARRAGRYRARSAS